MAMYTTVEEGETPILSLFINFDQFSIVFFFFFSTRLGSNKAINYDFRDLAKYRN